MPLMHKTIMFARDTESPHLQCSHCTVEYIELGSLPVVFAMSVKCGGNARRRGISTARVMK